MLSHIISAAAGALATLYFIGITVERKPQFNSEYIVGFKQLDVSNFKCIKAKDSFFKNPITYKEDSFVSGE
jgi:hypothetical protein